MKRFLLIAYLFICTFTSFAQGPAWLWAVAAAGVDQDYGRAISTDTAGNSYCGGSFGGSFAATGHFGNIAVTTNGGADVFVAKYDKHGNCLWVQTGGSSDIAGPDRAAGIALDKAGNCYVTGYFYYQAFFGQFYLSCPYHQTQVFIAKYSVNGNLLWIRQVGGGHGDNWGTAIAVDEQGNPYITGNLTADTSTFGNFTLYGPGAFAAKYDAQGNVIYATKLGTSGHINSWAIAVNKNNETYLAGDLNHPDTIGSNYLSPSGTKDALWIKLDAQGQLNWLKQVRSIPLASSTAQAIAVDPAGNFAITGSYDTTIQVDGVTLFKTPNGGSTCFIARFDSAGHELWVTSGINTANFIGAAGMGITSDRRGNFAVTGYFAQGVSFGSHTLTSSSNSTVFVTLYDSVGNNKWAISSSGVGSWATGVGISTDNKGSYFITGWDKNPATFGDSVLPYIGKEDLFIARINAPLEVSADPINISCHTNCTGHAIAQPFGGVAPYSYNWSTGQTGDSIQNLCAGKYFVTATDNDGASAADSVMIGQSQSLYVDIPATSICIPGSATLNATTQGGTSYHWQNGDTSSTIQISQGGYYTVTVYDDSTCFGTGTIYVQQFTPDSVRISAGNTLICASDSVLICATPGKVSYIWNTTAISTCITTSLAGNYYVTATDLNGCTAQSNVIVVSVYEPTQVSVSIKGDTLTVHNASQIHWEYEGHPIPGAFDSIYIAPRGGDYSVQVVDSNGCVQHSNSFTITALNDLSENAVGVKVFPNPFNTEAVIAIEGTPAEYELQVFDAAGKLMRRQKSVDNTFHVFKTDLSAGVYLYQIQQKNIVVGNGKIVAE